MRSGEFWLLFGWGVICGVFSSRLASLYSSTCVWESGFGLSAGSLGLLFGGVGVERLPAYADE